MKRSTHKSRQSGISMIEMLVTLIVLMVGLLGLAGLMMHAQRAEMESYQRVQALILLQDMVGRINANRKVTDYQVIAVGTAAVDPCPGVTVAETDACQWHNAILGAAEKSGASNVGAMIDGRGCVSYDPKTEAVNNTALPVTSTLDGATIFTAAGAAFPNSGTYTVSVAWQGLGATFAQTGNLCGKDKYGDDDGLRRVVNLTLKLAPLG